MASRSHKGVGGDTLARGQPYTIHRPVGSTGDALDGRAELEGGAGLLGGTHETLRNFMDGAVGEVDALDGFRT